MCICNINKVGEDFEEKPSNSYLFSTQPPEPEILYDILAESNEDKDENIFNSDED